MTTEQLADLIDNRPDNAIIHGDKAAAELRRLAAIEAAAKKLVSAKGRYHTEQNYRALETLIKETP